MSHPPGSHSFPLTQNESPEVEIEIGGLINTTTKTLKAVVDTGFTGFVQVPIGVGIGTNLNLWGTQTYTLADGTTSKTLECVGKVKFLGKEMLGVISLAFTGNMALLGIVFLQELGMDMVVSTSTKEIQ